MVSVTKTLLICGYHILTIVTIVFGFICSKTMVKYCKDISHAKSLPIFFFIMLTVSSNRINLSFTVYAIDMVKVYIS